MNLTEVVVYVHLLGMVVGGVIALIDVRSSQDRGIHIYVLMILFWPEFMAITCWMWLRDLLREVIEQ